MNNETSYFFLFQIISFKKYFYVSLGNIFYCFCGGPPSCGGPGNCPVCPPLNPALGVMRQIRYFCHNFSSFLSKFISRKFPAPLSTYIDDQCFSQNRAWNLWIIVAKGVLDWLGSFASPNRLYNLMHICMTLFCNNRAPNMITSFCN